MSAKEFVNILQLADEQTVFGLVFDVLKDTNVDGLNNLTPLYEAIGLLEQIKRHRLRLT